MRTREEIEAQILGWNDAPAQAPGGLASAALLSNQVLLIEVMLDVRTLLMGTSPAIVKGTSPSSAPSAEDRQGAPTPIVKAPIACRVVGCRQATSDKSIDGYCADHQAEDRDH